MINISDYIETAFDAMKTVVDKVYLDRPASVAAKVSSYAVVECGSYISNREIDPSGGLNYYVTTMNIDLFVRDKQTSQATNQRNIKALDTLLKQTLSLFPIVDREKSVKIHQPRVILSSSDGDGWHYALITARLTTYI